MTTIQLKGYLSLLTILLLAFPILVISESSLAEDPHPKKHPRSYVIERLKSNDIVFLGAKHKQSTGLRLLSDLIPDLHDAGVTHLGLEICSDQQHKINDYMQKGSGLPDIRLHFQIDCPEYRSLLKLISALDEKKRPRVVALDLPKSMYKGEINRDEWMARTIANTFLCNPGAKMLVAVGNLHVLKRIEWEGKVLNRHGFIRSYLTDLMPGLGIFSIGQCIDEPHGKCDFVRRFSTEGCAVALDCDGRFAGWKIGIMAPVAARPAEVCELLDGIIVY